MRTRLALLAVGVAVAGGLACDRGTSQTRASSGPEPAPTTPRQATDAARVEEPVSDSPIQVTWTLQRQGDALVGRYTITSTAAAPIFVLDRLVTGSAKGRVAAFDRAVIRDGDVPGLISMVKGYVAPSMRGGVGGVLAPISRELAPGASLEGELRVPLPVTAWHNFQKASALRNEPEKAVLEIGYLEEQERWVTVKLADGRELESPAHPFVGRQKLARGPVVDIPE